MVYQNDKAQAITLSNSIPSGVMSFNGREGEVVPQDGDYTFEMVGAVPTSRKINGQQLNQDITLTPGDIGAQVAGSYVPTSRKINGKALTSDLTIEETYSTTETRIGTWVNGKPLYCKTFLLTSPSEETTHHVLVSVSNLNIDEVIDVCGTLANGNSYVSINQYYSTTNWVSTWVDRKLGVYCKLSGSINYNKPMIVVIKYTKTTDQATIQLTNSAQHTTLISDVLKNEIEEAYASSSSSLF